MDIFETIRYHVGRSTTKENDMIERYTREKMGKLWSPEQKFTFWLKVELAIIAARISRGEIDAKIPDDLLERVKIDPKEIDRIEAQETKHDMIAFLMHVSPQLPEELRAWLHHRITSYDIEDNALGLTLIQSVQILLDGVRKVQEVMKRIAFKYKDTPMIGRTHGIHAEPITFGSKFAKWYTEMERHRVRLERLRETVAVGKLSGAVGMYTLDPQLEGVVCWSLGLKPVLATQIIPRDIITEYSGVVANIAGSLGTFCTTLRGLARTEIREVMEFFDKKQRGSSAMPHKKNPISWESITGLCRDIGPRFMTAFQDQTTWDERDLANSAPERLFLPDISIALDFALHRFASSIDKMIVFPEQMMKNLELTKGLVFSQEVQALVAEKSGLPREEAYALVQKPALRCWESGFELDFYNEVDQDPDIMQYISPEELELCFDLKEKLKHVNVIFTMAFNS